MLKLKYLWIGVFMSIVFICSPITFAKAMVKPGVAAEQAAAKPKPVGAKQLININTADVQGLRSVKGIGLLKAKAIVNFREKNGSFKSIDDLVKIRGIGKKYLNKIRAYLTVS